MNKNYLFLFLFAVFSINGFAQNSSSENPSVEKNQFRALVGISGYLESDFKNSAFVEVGSGLEVKIHRLFKPEVGISYFVGELSEDINRDTEGHAIDLLEKKVSALNFNLTPKICLCSNESSSGDIFFQLLPRYNISKIEAVGNYTIINQSNPSNSVTKKEIITEWQQSFGIGIGVDIILSDKNYDSLAVNLYYNGVNLGKALNDLSHNNARYNSKTLGFGISYYLGFKKKE
jgi:opacity protein-like surface antigen